MSKKEVTLLPEQVKYKRKRKVKIIEVELEGKELEEYQELCKSVLDALKERESLFKQPRPKGEKE